MSRLINAPIIVPAGITCQVNNGVIKVTGQHGSLDFKLHNKVSCIADKDRLSVSGDPAQRGTAYRVIESMIHGVSKLHKRLLTLHGVGYKAAIAGKQLKMSLLYSKEVVEEIPADLKVQCPNPTSIEISGVDAVQVGDFAYKIFAHRKPSCYAKGYISDQARPLPPKKKGK